jgi:hypothetical protein
VVVQVFLLFILCRGVTRAFWGGLDSSLGGSLHRRLGRLGDNGLGSNNPPTHWHNRLGGLDSRLGSRLGGSVKEGTSGIGLGVLIGIFHYVMLCYVIIDGAFYLTPRFSKFRDC